MNRPQNRDLFLSDWAEGAEGAEGAEWAGWAEWAEGAEGAGPVGGAISNISIATPIKKRVILSLSSI